MTDLIWYAAYGSNLLTDRFLAYLRGGPVPFSELPQHGSRNPADPVADQRFRIARRLGFGMSSKRWNGRGVCFVYPGVEESVTDDQTLGRAWLVTVDQLADVWAQENGETVGPPIDVDRLAQTGTQDLGRGWYRRLEYLGELDGHPVATFTSAEAPDPNAADESYLAVTGTGLIEAWGMSPKEAATYLCAKPGNAGVANEAEVARLLEELI